MIQSTANKFKQAAFRSNTNYFKKMSSEGLIFAVILSCTFIFLVASIIRVINNARNNYEIFNSEESSLKELQDKNAGLKSDLDYVTSDEYKKLYLRDTQGLGQSNEQLFIRREQSDKIEEETEYLSLTEKNDYSDWWRGLLIW